VLAPVLFNVFLVPVTLLSRGKLLPDDCVGVRYRLDGGIFNTRRLKEVSKTRTQSVYELQYADDSAIVSHTVGGLHRNLDAPKKTEVLHTMNTREEEPPQLQVGV
jgi:hypothetical protein